MKIPAFGDDFSIAGVAGGGLAPASRCITLAQRRGERLVAEVPQHVAMVLQPPSDDMDDVAVRIALDHAVDRHQPRAHDDLALLLEHVRPDYEVGDTGLVFQSDEDDALGASWPLPDEDEAGD